MKWIFIASVFIVHAVEASAQDTTYYLNGKQILTIGNQVNGSYSEYYEDGQLARVEFRSDFLREGLWLTYYENGQKCTEGAYKNDQKNGVFTNYYENGQIASQGKFVNDKMEGVWKEYADNGNLKSVIKFKNGEMILEKYYNADGSVDKYRTKK